MTWSLVRIDSREDRTDSHAGELATVMGWGARDAERRFDRPNTPDALHGVELAVGTHEYCSNAWVNRGKFLVFNQKNLNKTTLSQPEEPLSFVPVEKGWMLALAIQGGRW